MRRLPGWRRRTMSAVLGVAMLGALAFGVSQAFAGQGSAVSKIRNHRDSCASTSKSRVVGTATFARKGNTVTLKVSINKGEPGDYDLYLYNASCDSVGPTVNFKVDASGNGSATLTATGVTGQSFFADAYNTTTGYDNESDYVKL